VPKSKYFLKEKKTGTIKKQRNPHIQISEKTTHSFSSSRNFGPEFALLFFWYFRTQHTYIIILYHHQNFREIQTPKLELSMGTATKAQGASWATLNSWGLGPHPRRKCAVASVDVENRGKDMERYGKIWTKIGNI
jgi:hypothetical protein